MSFSSPVWVCSDETLLLRLQADIGCREDSLIIFKLEHGYTSCSRNLLNSEEITKSALCSVSCHSWSEAPLWLLFLLYSYGIIYPFGKGCFSGLYLDESLRKAIECVWFWELSWWFTSAWREGHCSHCLHTSLSRFPRKRSSYRRYFKHV